MINPIMYIATWFGDVLNYYPEEKNSIVFKYSELPEHASRMPGCDEPYLRMSSHNVLIKIVKRIKLKVGEEIGYRGQMTKIIKK